MRKTKLFHNWCLCLLFLSAARQLSAQATFPKTAWPIHDTVIMLLPMPLLLKMRQLHSTMPHWLLKTERLLPWAPVSKFRPVLWKLIAKANISILPLLIFMPIMASPSTNTGGGRVAVALIPDSNHNWQPLPKALMAGTRLSKAMQMRIKVFAVDDTKAKPLRDAGFGTVLSHVKDGIARGTGAVVTLANEKENLVILKEKASAHYSFSKGTSTQSYPSSMMGMIALLRQTYLDAQWYKNKPATGRIES